MSDICCNKECVYWMRAPDGLCDAAGFCGGFIGEKGGEEDE